MMIEALGDGRSTHINTTCVNVDPVLMTRRML